MKPRKNAFKKGRKKKGNLAEKAFSRKIKLENGLKCFPRIEEAELKNGARLLLRFFKDDYLNTARYVAFPSEEEIRNHPELIALNETGSFDVSPWLRGAIGYIKAELFDQDIKDLLDENKIRFGKPAVYVRTIQMRRPFVKSLPNRIRKRFWHFDHLLLEKFEQGLAKAGIKLVIVQETRTVPPTQKAKLYKALLSSHGYRPVLTTDINRTSWPRGNIYWLKKL